ncbi:GDSL esterase/lipase At4g28780 [Selaginella moellendorffii]|uniref:GDSL esterase/lipase At4g28780 n=1 Tax=Selaginella moellendorffii TaxID=88036 RepID=UPI000D1C8D00|nr:GDSL esterase/lipase At4g28780 [Selaginella moellendorffii]|eukprot:XP_024518509.1 GDSL esterase/lipase At4g28780 [Selaginella moellendorffii]
MEAFQLLVLLTFLISVAAAGSASRSKAKAMFVFGDSLVDAGNNNFINSIARANFAPNGIDFPNSAATGRFCNGKIISDLLSDYMGTPPILPVLDPQAKGQNLLLGVNFASAGAGILDDTGTIFIQRLTMTDQFRLFRKYKSDLAAVAGASAAAKLISDGIYSFTVGGNDYINNYLLLFAQRARQYTPSQFNALLIATLRNQLKTVYSLGARKVTVSNMGPIGCIPSQLQRSSRAGECIQELNDHALSFNAALKPMIEGLNRELKGATFVYVNSYDILNEYIQNPSKYGFQYTNMACCGQGSYNGLLTCTGLSNLCSDRTKYVFWDAFHPSESINRLITNRLLNGPPSDLSPFNVKQLIAMST